MDGRADTPGGGVLILKGGTGMSCGYDPLFTPLLLISNTFRYYRPNSEQKLEILTATRKISPKKKTKTKQSRKPTNST